MGGPNKLLQDYAGEPLVRHAAKAALASGADPVLVVTGHQDAAVRQALAGLALGFVHNPAFAEGLSTSLKTGVGALPQGVEAAAIVLGDMPLVGAELIGALAMALLAQEGAIAAVPVLKGEWGNPVVLSRALFPAVSSLSGDAGARRLLQGRQGEVVEVPVSDDAVALDVDTPDALRELIGRGARSSPSDE
jgi:molybdenum cofactor cytidylyltransferase